MAYMNIGIGKYPLVPGLRSRRLWRFEQMEKWGLKVLGDTRRYHLKGVTQ